MQGPQESPKPEGEMSYVELVALIKAREGRLPRRTLEVARFLLNHPEDVAISSIVELGRLIGVQPSTISRFSRELGFEGFNGLQNVFRQRLIGPRMSYSERLKALDTRIRRTADDDVDLDDPQLVFDTFAQSAEDALLRFREEVSAADLQEFVEVLDGAPAIYLLASRGAFGVAAYAFYCLARVGRKAHLVDNVGAMRHQQIAAMGDDDVLWVMTFDEYSDETIEVTRMAYEAGRKTLVVTDNELSPVANAATSVIFVKEAQLGHFRSQVPTMVLCQSLIVCLRRRRDERLRVR